MEGEEEIGLVLARASDLRSRISACAAAARAPPRFGAREEEDGGEDYEEEEVGMESLVGINDALESLERQLASLQADVRSYGNYPSEVTKVVSLTDTVSCMNCLYCWLNPPHLLRDKDLQHQQRYERETILSQIDRSRTSLLSKLREYKGDDCDVIHEAAAFAGEKIENDDSLILPPYLSHVTNSFVLDDLYPTNYVSKSNCLHNGLGSNGTTEDGTRTNGLPNRTVSTSSQNSGGGIRSFIGWMAKTAVMVVGAVSIMKAAGYKPTVRRSSIKLDIAGLFRKEVAGAKEQVPTLQCPPGKVMVVEDGRAHCVVKERVEIPFGTNLSAPDASYGLG